MSDDQHTDTEQQKTKHAEPRGSEHVPAPGPLATKEQIANFWAAREAPGWDPGGQTAFLTRHEALERQNPELDREQRGLHTSAIHAQMRADVAKTMSIGEVQERFEALGMPDSAKEVRQQARFYEVGGDDKQLEKYRIERATRVQEIEDRHQYNAYHRVSAAQRDKPENLADNTKDERRAAADEITGRNVELTDAQQARLERLRSSTFRETSNEITKQNDGRNIGP